MKGRCHNPNNSGYRYWGEKGVSVCARWRESFTAFLEDMGESPSQQHSLDRFPDKNGNYEPGNVRWATRSEQQRNKRNSVYLDVRGERRLLQEWAEAFGVPAGTIAKRIKRGWTHEDAVTRPFAPNQWHR